MRNFSFKNIKRSIFFKLLLIFLATAVLLASLSAVVINYIVDPERLTHHAIENNLHRYSQYLIAEIGTPPDFQKAEILANELKLEIKIKSANKSWQSSEYHVPTKHFYVNKEVQNHPSMKIGHGNGYSFVSTEHKDVEYLFAIDHRRMSHAKGQAVIAFICILFIVIAFSYSLVRWQFRPIKWLAQGVSKVSEGDFTVQVPVRKNDEIGELSEAFNQMSAQIQKMMTSKEQLLLDVSHELRSPIARMKLATEMLEDQEYKQCLQSDLREMELMITELLESARLSNKKNQLDKQNTDVNVLLLELLEVYKNQKPGVRYEINSSALIMKIDRERLKIVIRNVLENALKYSRNQVEPVELLLKESDQEIKIIVIDHGQGIPEKDLLHVFEPFYRVDKSRSALTGGYGLGLSLCQKIVEAHQGNIAVTSEEGHGSKFIITLPRV